MGCTKDIACKCAPLNKYTYIQIIYNKIQQADVVLNQAPLQLMERGKLYCNYEISCNYIITLLCAAKEAYLEQITLNHTEASSYLF